MYDFKVAILIAVAFMVFIGLYFFISIVRFMFVPLGIAFVFGFILGIIVSKKIL